MVKSSHIIFVCTVLGILCLSWYKAKEARLLNVDDKDYQVVAKAYESIKMHSDSTIPNELKYLIPVIEFLSSAEDLGSLEDDPIYIDEIEKALKSRLAGISKEKAKERFDSDFRLLVGWLKHPENNENIAHFIEGYYNGLVMHNGLDIIIDGDSH